MSSARGEAQISSRSRWMVQRDTAAVERPNVTKQRDWQGGGYVTEAGRKRHRQKQSVNEICSSGSTAPGESVERMGVQCCSMHRPSGWLLSCCICETAIDHFPERVMLPCMRLSRVPRRTPGTGSVVCELVASGTHSTGAPEATSTLSRVMQR